MEVNNTRIDIKKHITAIKLFFLKIIRRIRYNQIINKQSSTAKDGWYLDEQDLIDLKDARELVIQTESMLKHKLDILKRNIELVAIAQNRISKIIYKLTGDKFYKPEENDA